MLLYPPVFNCRPFLLLLMLCCAAVLRGQSATPKQAFADSMALLNIHKKFDEDAKTWYAIYNIGAVIHVYLAVADPLQQRKILTNGMEVWIDPKGKKNKKTGIFFPLATQPAGQKNPEPPSPPAFNSAGNSEAADTGTVKALAAVAAQKEMKVTGFREELNGMQNILHPSGMAVRLYFIKDTLVYEAQLPLNIFAETPAVHSHMSVCLVQKGMNLPVQGGNDLPPDGGGMDGMMPPPGGPPPGSEDRMQLFQDDVIWYKFILQ